MVGPMFCDVTGEAEPGDGRHRRQDPEERREAAEQRQHAIALGLLPEQLLELLELVGVLGREVVRLGEVVGQVVQLPDVLLGVVGSGLELASGSSA